MALRQKSTRFFGNNKTANAPSVAHQKRAKDASTPTIATKQAKYVGSSAQVATPL